MDLQPGDWKVGGIMVGCDFFFLQIAGPITGRLIGGGQNLRSDVILFSQVNLLIAGGLISGGGT